jgi:hypothetical protein
MNKITIAVGALAFCTIAPISAKTKTEHSACVDKCREYYCSGGMSRQLYCQNQCIRKCLPKGNERK